MKLKGFTLAELLIAMIIVGVLSAIVVPSLGKGTETNKNAARVPSTLEVLENAFGSMLSDDDADDISETVFYKNIVANDLAAARLRLSNYMKFSATDAIVSNSWADYTTTMGNNSIPLKLANGSVIQFFVGGHDVANINYYGIIMDVNGSRKPNRFGFDQFAFVMDGTNASLSAAGSDTWNSVYGNGWNCPNPVGNANGVGCTNTMVEDNYKINYTR